MEASSCCHPDLEVLNTVVNISDLDDDSNALVMMSVLIKARSDCNVMVGPSDIVCSLRAVNSDCERALTDFHIARLTRESSSVPETGPEASSARIASSRYRTATRAEDPARLFLALEAEIKTRQEQMKLPLVDQSGKENKAHMC